MNWIPLQSEADLSQLIEKSKSTPCIIFKHSTRCSISSIAKFRLEGDWDFDPEQVNIYYLDLINYRNLSHLVAETFSVTHESPQLLLIKNGVCTYDSSHLDITVDELKECLMDE
ncbi:MAG TPA: bacillithiol system redox-active protein YtxJ [Bacteroidetes bacterium]|nr:bacillithiol system redox-active protein YtxJ [Bacteroidota bacterium]